MPRNLLHLVAIGGCAAILACSPASADDASSTNLVFADYHVARFTRLHDGANGLWQVVGASPVSRLRDTAVSYNPDLIDDNGRNQIAATSYPLVGMQSDLDPDYLEYQVLSAKWTHIDGFMVEWGAPDHAGNAVLLALEQMAQKYGLKVGVNWCIAWAKQGIPANSDREHYLRRLEESEDYLLATLYAEPNAARFNGRPVLMIFGGDLNSDEFHRLAVRGGERQPLLLRQAMVSGSTASGRLVMSAADTSWFRRDKGFASDVGGFFGWVPSRLRYTTGPEAKWDRYAEADDAPGYLETLLSLPLPDRPFLRMTSASPGFDNRPAAGWKKNDLSYVPRGQYEVYDAMWRFNLADRARFDWVLIPTWNDWTEGSQIQPSVEDRGAALVITERHIAAFKHIASAPDGMSLPLRLFRLRKGWARLERISGAASAHEATLDAIAQAISNRAVTRASRMISTAEQELAVANARLPRPKHVVLRTGTQNGLIVAGRGPQALYLALPASVADRLRTNPFDAVLEFDYRAAATTEIALSTATARPSSGQGDYAIVAQIDTKASADWKRARVRIYAQNATFSRGLPYDSDLAFTFSQPIDLRNVSVTFDIYPKAFIERGDVSS